MKTRWPDWAWDTLGLGALMAAFFWPVTLGLGWIPAGGGDMAALIWPLYSYAARALWAGRVPLWSEALFGGMPFVADNQTGVFYPPNLLAFALAPDFPYRALEWLVVAHCWLAGVGMYALLRAWLAESPAPLSLLAARGAAWAGGVAFALNDVFITHIGNPNIIAAASWLPWVILGWHTALRRADGRGAALTGAALALSVLAGHAQTTLMVGLTLAGYALWELARTRQIARTLQSGAVTGAVALGLSAITLLPTLELIPFTARARLAYAEAAEYSLPWAGLAGLLSPAVFGRGAAEFWAGWARVETGYAGVITLLAPLGLAWRKPGLTWFLAGLAGLGVLIALGANTPVHGWLYASVPGFAQLRVPARFILLTDFALAGLLGLGLAHGRHSAWRAALAVTVALAVLWGTHSLITASTPDPTRGRGLLWAGAGWLTLGGLWLALTRWPGPRAVWLAALAVAVDLWLMGAHVEISFSDPTQGFQHPASVQFLRAQTPPTRIDHAGGAWSPNSAARHGLEDVGGISNPLTLAAYTTYAGAVGWRGSPLYNFLNAQFLVADKNQPAADSSFVPVFNADPQVDVYLNTNARPRARLVFSAEHVPDGEAAFAAILRPGFDPEQHVILESRAAPRPLAPPGPSNLFYTRYAPEEFSIVAQTPGPAYLVLSETWYPGWQAWVDDTPTPIERANFAFRAVYVPGAGEHTITLRYQPLSWAIGLAWWLATVAGLALAGWRWRAGSQATITA